MAVFRVERNKGYTVMSNHHLRNKELSLKAKGLLSQMLSLPEDWDYTLAGLSFINREKIDAIREAVKELERAGYIVRSRERDEKGRLRGADYVIFEQPQTPPVSDLPTLENPTLDNPTLEKPTQEKPTLENPTQLNKDIQKTNLPKKEKSNIDLSSTDSIPIHSLNPLPYDGEAAEPPERKRKEATDAYSVYEEIIKDNIEYDHFVRYGQVDKDRLDEIVSIILETVCSKRKTVRIAGDDYPAELVKAKFMKLNSSHIEFVFDCMKENTTKIRNIKQYLTIVQGNPGEGKTTFALRLAAACTTGRTLPNMKPLPPFNVIYQTAEDGLGDTVKPRLMEAAADLDRVLVIDEAKQELSLSDERIERAIRQTGARLIILDPIQSNYLLHTALNELFSTTPKRLQYWWCL